MYVDNVYNTITSSVHTVVCPDTINRLAIITGGIAIISSFESLEQTALILL